jgi:biotin carboxyl carrier protein
LHFEIASASSTSKVEVAGERGRKEIRIDGRVVAVDWLRLPGNRYSLLIDGRVYDLSVRVDGESCTVSDRNGTRTLRVLEPRKKALSPSTDAGRSGLQRICAEMPGKVVRVSVSVGDTVAENDAMVVLEAMKMQNEIRAPRSGTIREVRVEPGRTVGTGELLVSLE